jgi:energy-coupling factor transport system substrate-specific component
MRLPNCSATLGFCARHVVGRVDSEDRSSSVQRRAASTIIYILASLIGIWAFVAPLLTPTLTQAGELQAGGALAPLLLVGLVTLCYLALLSEAQGQAIGATTVALLGVLVAMNAALRFAETVVPGPGGFSPMFLLIILTGYVFGARIGFLMGALSLMASALVTGGVGPWLPFQMWAAGWVGMSAPLVRPVVRLLRAEQRLGEVISLATLGAAWGIAYGALMNLWFWPYVAGDAATGWVPGMDLSEGLRHYLAFYLLTSFGWDLFAAAGNVALLVLFAAPALRALRRFQSRMSFTHSIGTLPPATSEVWP